MMSWFVGRFNYTRDLLKTYGDAYTGIYLAIVLAFVLILIYNRRDKREQSFIYYLSVMLVLFFVPGLMPGVTSLIFKEDFGIDLYMIFPVMIVTVVGIAIIGNYIVEKNPAIEKKRFLRCIVAATFVLTLVEASVPLQITFQNFVIPSKQGKHHKEVEAVSALVQDESVLLPGDLQSEMKIYNWNTSMPLYYRSDIGPDMDAVLKYAGDNKISYVVVKIKNYLGEEMTFEQEASDNNYESVERVGNYVVYRLNDTEE